MSIMQPNTGVSLSMKNASTDTPKEGRYLAYCKVDCWTGLIDVFYRPTRGWMQCQSKETGGFDVLWYMPIPLINGESVYDSDLDYNE